MTYIRLGVRKFSVVALAVMALSLLMEGTALAHHQECVTESGGPSGSPNSWNVTTPTQDTWVWADGPFSSGSLSGDPLVGTDLNGGSAITSSGTTFVCVGDLTGNQRIAITTTDSNPASVGKTARVGLCRYDIASDSSNCSTPLNDTGVEQTRPPAVTTGPLIPVCVGICVNVPGPPYKVDTGYDIFVGGTPFKVCIAIGTSC